MKKSSFVALVLGTVAGVLFALGMCMVLLPEFGSFGAGVALGLGGQLIGLITWLIWRKMEKKPPIKFTKKLVARTALMTAGGTAFGGGLTLCIVGERFVIGTIVGLVGIVALLALIPLVKGLK